jgi:hypothetical protein
MNDILTEYNIRGPIQKMISRSPKPNKKESNIKMSGQMPTIKVENDETGRHKVKVKNPITLEGIEVIRDSDSDSGSNATAQPEPVINSPRKKVNKKQQPQPQEHKSMKKSFDPKEYQYFINSQKHKPDKSESGSSSGYDSYSESGSGSFSDNSSESDAPRDREREKDSSRKKQEILIKLMALEKRGVELTRKFSMKTSLSDLEFEYELHKKTAETDAGVIFQQKILMAAVTGMEFLNNKFDPINAKLDGWSESVMDNMTDYDDVFRRLYEKYKTRAQMAPELQLLVTLGGSAFMFHLTQTLFKTALPNINDALANNPDIMNSISQAMSQSMTNNPKQPPSQNSREMTGPSVNLSSMIGDRPLPMPTQRPKSSDQISLASSSSVSTAREVIVSTNGKKSIDI